MYHTHTHIIRDYKMFNSLVNTELILLLFECVTHAYKPNLVKLWW